MKNSSGAIGAAKALPYLVSHRRIINVIRIMYPRNSDRQGSPAGLRRKKGEGWGIAEGEARIYVVGYIAEVPVGKKERGRRSGRGGGRCVYKGNADGALTIVHPDRGVYSPSSTPEPRTPRCDAKPTYFAFAAFYTYSKRRPHCSTCAAIRVHVSATIFSGARTRGKVREYHM